MDIYPLFIINLILSCPLLSSTLSFFSRLSLYCDLKFLCPGEGEKLQDVMGKLLTGRTLHDLAFKFRCKNGEAKHYLIDSNAVFIPSGEISHIRFS